MENAKRFRVASRLHQGIAFRLACAAYLFLPTLLVTWTAVLLGAPWLVLLLPLVMMHIFLLLHIYPATLAVGIDGVHLRWLGTERFFPFASIEAVAAKGRHTFIGRTSEYLQLDLRDGSHARIVIDHSSFGFGTTPQLSRRLAATIRAGSAAAVRRLPALPCGVGSHVEGHLEDRVDALRAMGRPPNHRLQSVDLEALWAVVEHPGAQTRDRAAAALVLSGTPDADTAARLRLVARSVADPLLGRLLDSLVAGRLTDVRTACAELEQRAL